MTNVVFDRKQRCRDPRNYFYDDDEWANPGLERNRDGIFPYEWRSHEYGKRKFPMNHEWHIPIFPMKGFAGVVKNNFPMSGEATNGEIIFYYDC